MADSDLIAKIGAEQDHVVDLLRALVERESPSGDKRMVDRLGAFISGHIHAQGLDPQTLSRDEVGDIIWAEWSGPGDGRILVLCHIDTVWEVGSLDRNPFRLEDGRLHGTGIYDMKAGVAATLKVQEYMSRGWIFPRRNVRFLYTTDEELTSRSSREVIEEFALASDYVLVTEPPLPDGGLKTARKGVGTYRVQIQGKAAHSGVDPEKGVNAVEELAHQIGCLHGLSSSSEGTTVSVTQVKGGTATNVIPDRAEAHIDTRFKTRQEGERVARSIQDLQPGLPGCSLEITGGIDRFPMTQNQGSRELFQSAVRIGSDLGLDLSGGESGGGSDGNITSALGVPTLDGLGVPGDGAHAWHEHVKLDALAPRIALLARLVERL